MSNEFRGSKYVNESGSKRGNWYMNRLDYFQFHEYPAYKKHKFLSLFVGVFFYFIGIEAFKISFLFFIPLFIYVMLRGLLSIYYALKNADIEVTFCTLLGL